MGTSKGPQADEYEPFYREFDSPLMRQLRREAYGEDIGQHSWVGAAELREDIPRLKLSPGNRLLDLDCGPCGPLTFILAARWVFRYGRGTQLLGAPSRARARRFARHRSLAVGPGGRFERTPPL